MSLIINTNNGPVYNIDRSLVQIVDGKMDSRPMEVTPNRPIEKVVAEEVQTKIVPMACRQAVDKVMAAREIKGPNGVVLNAQKQVIEAARLVDMTSGANIAVFMVACQMEDVFKRGVGTPDVIRALIGLGIIPYESEKEIGKYSDAVNKKLNGYSDSRTGKVYAGLSMDMKDWTYNADIDMARAIIKALKATK